MTEPKTKRESLDQTLRKYARACEMTGNGTSETCTMVKQAADRIEALEAALREIDGWRNDTLGRRPSEQPHANEEAFDRGARMAFYRCSDRARTVIEPARNPVTSSPLTDESTGGPEGSGPGWEP